jgi:hypothetical protein
VVIWLDAVTANCCIHVDILQKYLDATYVEQEDGSTCISCMARAGQGWQVLYMLYSPLCNLLHRVPVFVHGQKSCMFIAITGRYEGLQLIQRDQSYHYCQTDCDDYDLARPDVRYAF